MKNKENTKRKLIDAVGHIIKNEGFTGLGVNKVAKTAKVSKILIYRYFGGFAELLQVSVMETDFWKNFLSENTECDEVDMSVREHVCKILAEQFNTFYNHCDMEARIVAEISRSNALVKNIVREESTPAPGSYSNVVSTLLQAGTDHLIIAEQDKAGISEPEDSATRKTDLKQSIDQIVDWTLD